MLMTAVVNLFTTIPSTPGYVGTFDAPGIAILTQFGVVHAVAAGYTLVLHVCLVVAGDAAWRLVYVAPEFDLA